MAGQEYGLLGVMVVGERNAGGRGASRQLADGARRKRGAGITSRLGGSPPPSSAAAVI